MRLDTAEDHSLILREVYNGIILETAEGNRLNVCMRDDTFELSVLPLGGSSTKWRVDMRNETIKRM